MKIIFSPAKKMRQETDEVSSSTTPLFFDEAACIWSWLQGLSYDEAKKLWEASDAIARPAYERLHTGKLKEGIAQALLAFDGIAFSYLAPDVLEEDALCYLQENLLILSALYGCLKPFDRVVPYRLEMKEKARVAGTKNLYEFWKDKIYRQAFADDHLLVNLASQEYSKMISPYLSSKEQMISCIFAQKQGAKLVQKGVWCKMARGEMLRFIAIEGIKKPADLKYFPSTHWHFSETDSTACEYVFLFSS